MKIILKQSKINRITEKNKILILERGWKKKNSLNKILFFLVLFYFLSFLCDFLNKVLLFFYLIFHKWLFLMLKTNLSIRMYNFESIYKIYFNHEKVVWAHRGPRIPLGTSQCLARSNRSRQMCQMKWQTCNWLHHFPCLRIL